LIPELRDAELATVIGPVASGKTFLLKRWLEGLERVTVFDPTGEYDDVPNAEHFWATPRAFVEYLEKNPNKFRAIYHPGENLEEGFEWVASAMWQLSEPRFLFIEEIHELISPWNRHPKMKLIMKYARKRLLGVVGSTQRLADLHKDFTSASRLSVIFHTTEPNDLNAVRERWGDEGEDAVRNLRPLIYDDVSQATKQTPEALVIVRGSAPTVMEIG
jgi:DNA helicase HerA-like ATPase